PGARILEWRKLRKGHRRRTGCGENGARYHRIWIDRRDAVLPRRGGFRSSGISTGRALCLPEVTRRRAGRFERPPCRNRRHGNGTSRIGTAPNVARAGEEGHIVV